MHPSYDMLKVSYGPYYANPKPLDTTYYVVPTSKSFGYNALTHNIPTNERNYFSIVGAYPCSSTGMETTFQYRGCGSDQLQSNIPGCPPCSR